MAPPLDPHWGLMSLSTLGWTGPEGATPVHHQAAPVQSVSGTGPLCWAPPGTKASGS